MKLPTDESSKAPDIVPPVPPDVDFVCTGCILGYQDYPSGYLAAEHTGVAELVIGEIDDFIPMFQFSLIHGGLPHFVQTAKNTLRKKLSIRHLPITTIYARRVVICISNPRNFFIRHSFAVLPSDLSGLRRCLWQSPFR